MSATCRLCQGPDADGGFCDRCDLLDAGRVEAYSRGYDAALRDFWRCVCEREAEMLDDEATRAERIADIRAQHARLQEFAERWREDARRMRRGAARLRAWAGEP